MMMCEHGQHCLTFHCTSVLLLGGVGVVFSKGEHWLINIFKSTKYCFNLSYLVWYSILLMAGGDAAKPPFYHSSENLQDRAILHKNLMTTVGLCRDPRPLIEYPPSSFAKTYQPRGTIVHRCTDQTGCCPNQGELCRPETVDNFEKVFFVHHFILGQKISAGQRISPSFKAMKTNYTTLFETLTFVNHTSCKCIKLAPNAIEHDDIQSVISRPLIKSNDVLNTNSVLFHLLGVLAVIALIMVSYFVYKFIYITHSRRRNPRLV